MATESELRASVDSAISAVVAKIAAGQTITEWKEGSIHVKRSSPEELLRALKTMRDALSDDAGTGRCASVGMYRGPV